MMVALSEKKSALSEPEREMTDLASIHNQTSMSAWKAYWVCFHRLTHIPLFTDVSYREYSHTPGPWSIL